MSSKPEVTVKEWELIRRIFTAFRGVTLEDGVGLKQAEGMDNYGSPEQLAKLRHQDETENWERLSTDTLNECSSALSFFDAGGMRYHLPAYLIAALIGELEIELMIPLTDLHDFGLDRFSLLNTQQRAVVRDFLERCLVDSDEFFRPSLSLALSRYWRSPTHVRCEQ